MDIKAIRSTMKRIGLHPEQFFYFTIDRNPYTFMLSSIFYSNATYNNAHQPRRVKDACISSRILSALDNPRYLSRLNFRMYTSMHRKILVDKVIRYENLSDELNALLFKLGVTNTPLNLPRLKSGAGTEHKLSMISNEARSRIQQEFAFVFDFLQYPR
jgi:hypothetical protein